MTRQDAWAGRPVVERYKAFGIKLRQQAKEQGYDLGEQLVLTFLIPMPDSWSQKKRLEMEGKPHKSKPDIDNLMKGFMDALLYNTGKTDEKVWSVSACKLWDKKGAILVENYEA